MTNDKYTLDAYKALQYKLPGTSAPQVEMPIMATTSGIASVPATAPATPPANASPDVQAASVEQ